jgi:hypothetical protein
MDLIYLVTVIAIGNCGHSEKRSRCHGLVDMTIELQVIDDTSMNS